MAQKLFAAGVVKVGRFKLKYILTDVVMFLENLYSSTRVLIMLGKYCDTQVQVILYCICKAVTKYKNAL